MVCVSNWIFDWDYNAGTEQNECPSTSTCETFESRYVDAQNLCNILWANTFNYTQETSLCLTPNHYQVNTLVVNELFYDECNISIIIAIIYGL